MLGWEEPVASVYDLVASDTTIVRLEILMLFQWTKSHIPRFDVNFPNLTKKLSYRPIRCIELSDAADRWLKISAVVSGRLAGFGPKN